ncbi:MAG TPA: formate dehydrogenase accessory sulfurtransferase FdhD [Polyangia bacterium]|nr:formate dehydrogenase accessory sulfurtransferase FdhD [Polyangia bacterium]
MNGDGLLPRWDPRAARVVERDVQRRGPGGSIDDKDQIVVEEPLEIRIGGESLVVTMRTPGDDLDLAAGFFYSEGIIASMDDVDGIGHANDVGSNGGNVVVVTPRAGRDLSIAHARRVIRASAACGLCGVENIAAVRRRTSIVVDDLTVPLAVVSALPAAIRAAQPVFNVTGALHAVGLFRADGALLVVKEDVGRHNAVDKVIGHCLRAGARSLAGTVMMFSGRAGFEIVQKAAIARVPVVCAVSAPSSLAVDLAREVGVTLVGFVRGNSVNVYSHPERII